MRSIAAKVGALLGLLLSGCASADLPVQSIPNIPYSMQPTPAEKLRIQPASFMPASTEAAVTPAGYVGFCVRMPDQCALAANSSPMIQMTPAVWQALNDVDTNVNAAIWPEDDERHYGRAEYWTIPQDGYGDCEDYALAKRKALMTQGYSAAALRIAVVMTPDQNRHAVLTVSTDQGDYVLDNMRNDVVGWQQTGYVWIERQDPSNAMGWVSFQQPVLNMASNSAPLITGSGH